MELNYPEYKDKLDILKSIRHEIKKRRFILDENTEKFGFDSMSQLAKVKNTSEVKGYPFVVSKNVSKILKGQKLALKLLPSELKYEKTEHPANVECIILKELTDNIILKGVSPHIAFYIGNQKVTNKSRAVKFLNLKRLEVEELIRPSSNMLISQFVEGGSLDNWVYNCSENDIPITDIMWKGIVFQLIYTIAVLQKKYRLMHNDFHYGNILIDTSVKSGGYFVYTINNKTYYIPNNGCIPMGWDYEFSMVYSDNIEDFFPNKFIVGRYNYNRKTFITKDPSEIDTDSEMNVPYNYNETYDLHYFLTSLLDLYISQELFDWIVRLYPTELIPEDLSETTTDTTSDTTDATDATDTTNTTDTTDTIDSADITTDVVPDLENLEISDSSSSDSNESGSSNESSSSSGIIYLSDGRMINGVEKLFDNLPTPLNILNDTFFESLTIKPDDFEESKAVYFKAGF